MLKLKFPYHCVEEFAQDIRRLYIRDITCFYSLLTILSNMILAINAKRM